VARTGLHAAEHVEVVHGRTECAAPWFLPPHEHSHENPVDDMHFAAHTCFALKTPLTIFAARSMPQPRHSTESPPVRPE